MEQVSQNESKLCGFTPLLVQMILLVMQMRVMHGEMSRTRADAKRSEVAGAREGPLCGHKYSF